MKKNSGLNGIRAHDLCDTDAVLYRLSYQAIWELVTLRVRNIPVEGKECNIHRNKYVLGLVHTALEKVENAGLFYRPR